jgi:hypothetical protein
MTEEKALSLTAKDGKLEPGMAVHCYLDPEKEEGKLGSFILKEKVKVGSPFILEEMPESKQITFVLEHWTLYPVSLTELGETRFHPEKAYPIKVIANIGLTPTSNTPNHVDDVISS